LRLVVAATGAARSCDQRQGDEGGSPRESSILHKATSFFFSEKHSSAASFALSGLFGPVLEGPLAPSRRAILVEHGREMITRDADYAVRLVMHLTLSGPGTRHGIARAQQIPEGCLPRIVRALRRAEVIVTRSGKGGGICLARAPDAISLLDVVGAIDGFLPLNRCLVTPSACSRISICQVHPHWRGIQERFLADLRGTTFAEMASTTSPRARKSRVS